MTDNLLAGQPPTTADGGTQLLAWLREMRRNQPIWQEPSGAVHLFRHADVTAVLADPATFSSDVSQAAPDDVPNFVEGSLAATDPPRHRKLRRIVSEAFTPKTVASLEPRIVELTNELLDAVADRDEWEFVDALSNPLPVTVIAELLGIPVADQPKFRRWAEAAITATNDAQVGEAEFHISDWVAEQLREMQEYLLAHAKRRLEEPTGDLMTRLATAEVDGVKLTDNELFSFAADLLFAGHITTTMLLGNSLVSLHEHPDVAAEVRADRTLVPSFIEEVLRVRPPITLTNRLVRKDTHLGGVDVPTGGMVVAWMLSANYDEDKIPAPEAFDVHRDPNPHLAFGHGIHFCIGAPLGRLETRIALNILLNRYQGIRPSGDGPTYHDAGGLFGVAKLPLVVTPA
ncbi:Cytochrome P450 [Amycolatopsis marina]|uniref:Cytochrome P450 n=1 Tax=Amycolatopsis marina TaxID=490629 RepID=A0A1I0XX32_9PSEU|nr:cytochrome P450 [Amycolatopsis marina]SFB04718.1 Cytochrome P450 [Amycolatopsis marina]